MNRSWWLRAGLLIFFTLLSLMAVYPTVANLNEETSTYPIKSKINLGLDLQGGLYMVLGIDFNKVYRDEVINYVTKAQAVLADDGIKSSPGKLNIADLTDPRQELIVDDVAQLEAAKDKIREFFPSMLRVTNQNGGTIEYGLGSDFVNEVNSTAVKKSIEVIRNRIDEFGVTEPEILAQGEDKIVVQLPGVKDIERAKDLIGKTAKLEFKIVNEEVAPQTMMGWMSKAKEEGLEYKKGMRFSDYVLQINQRFQEEIPNGYQLVFQRVLSPVTNELQSLNPLIVQAAAPLTGEGLQDAGVRVDPQNNQPYVSLTFNPKGAQLFEDITDKNVGKRLAIVLDGNVYSDPVIQARIAGGNAQITLGAGGYEKLIKEASDLSLVLRAGALPVELEFQEQRVVGPSLGKDSIESARLAGIIGSFLVFIFIMVYYKISGVLAVTTLVLNVLFILACLVGLEATLTLPGIAGIALTVGMAVDANIIIFERIKEELAVGTPVREAVESGFSKAKWTIIDANLTTAVAGLMLYNFGTGPIRGFAVTLLIGIIATVYSSYFIGHLTFEWYMNKTRGKSIKI